MFALDPPIICLSHYFRFISYTFTLYFDFPQKSCCLSIPYAYKLSSLTVLFSLYRSWSIMNHMAILIIFFILKHDYQGCSVNPGSTN